jgi:hypothetical protein
MFQDLPSLTPSPAAGSSFTYTVSNYYIPCGSSFTYPYFLKAEFCNNCGTPSDFCGPWSVSRRMYIVPGCN